MIRRWGPVAALWLTGCAVTSGRMYDVEITRGIVYEEGRSSTGTITSSCCSTCTVRSIPGEHALPVVMTMHGGRFVGGTRRQGPHVEHARFFAAREFAAVSIAYRLQRDRPPADPALVERGVSYDPTRPAAHHAAVHAAGVDTKTALRWVHANAHRRGFDPDRVFVIGSSAGGFCAVMADTTSPDELVTNAPGQPIPAANHPRADNDVQMIVNLWGGAGPWLDEIDGSDPPMMLVYGTDDWLCPEGEALRGRCHDVGLPHTCFPLEGEGHAAWRAEIDGLSREHAILRFFRESGGLDP